MLGHLPTVCSRVKDDELVVAAFDQRALNSPSSCTWPASIVDQRGFRPRHMAGDYSMPKLNREVIREWLEEHNWTVGRLAEECSTLGQDVFREGSLRNAVNGIDPMRARRIRVICKVTAKFGDGLSYAELVEQPKQESDGNPPGEHPGAGLGLPINH